MSLVLAMEAREGYDEPHSMASDSICTSQDGTFHTDSVKLWKHGEALFGCVGDSEVKEELLAWLERSKDLISSVAHPDNLRTHDHVRIMMREFEEHLHQAMPWRTRDDGPCWSGWLGLVVTPVDGIAAIGGSGVVAQSSTQAIGAGTGFALGYLAAMRDRAPNTPGDVLVKLAVQAAVEDNIYLAGPVRVVTTARKQPTIPWRGEP